MGHSLSDYYFSVRLLRYRAESILSKRAAYRFRVLQEMPKWRNEGYNYNILNRDPLLIRATGAVYLPVSKAANTTMKHLIAEESPADEMSIHFGTPRGLQRLRDADITINGMIAGSMRSFTVVRNPIERFGSAYRDKIESPELTGQKKILWAFLKREKGSAISVDDLISYVAETTTEDLDKHFCPQWSCCGAGRIPLELIGKVENLERDVQVFVEAGLIANNGDNRLAIRNATGGNSERELTRQQRVKLMHLYERDFETFGY